MSAIRAFLNKQLADFDDAAFIRLLKIFTIATAVIIAYAFIFSGFQIVDEFEHLHASWLVSTGKLPYKDFLEHHNPLLWYISAPIVRLFYDNAIIFYVMRGITAIASILIGFYIYKIALFWSDKKGAWLAVALYLGNIITLYDFYQFRPDNYMNLCFVAGVYYLFCALKANQLRSLIISFLCFTLSFLFLQKISLLLLVIEFILLWLIWSKRLKLKNVTYAALPSVFILFLFLGFFYIKGALIEYFVLNYTFNQALIFYFERGTFWYPNIYLTLFSFAFISIFYFYNKQNIYFKIVSLLLFAEYLMRVFYFAPHTHYYSLLVIFSALVLSVYADCLMPSYKSVCAVIIIALFSNLGCLYNRLDESIQYHDSFKHYQLADWAHKNSQPDDIFMNGYDMIFNIYRPDVSYYWFQLDTLVPIMEKEYNLPKLDVNRLIVEKKPKFVYAANYIDVYALRYYGESKFSQKFIPELIQTLYKPTPFDGLWELK